MTLLELLADHSVKIPIIQRDYAQGRRNAQTDIIRRTLLNDMKRALCRTAQPLDLNFVYGKENGKEFIPIDGQQRLTTLFLLHLYAFRDDEEKTRLFENFTYKTRVSSREFIKDIVRKRGEIFNTNSEYKKPSDIITDSSDFVSSYNYDPTVRSVLVMLDEIAEVFADVPDLKEALSQTEEPLISFNFLTVNDLGSEDDLYIKLNARGKPLTDLENFKAKFHKRIMILSEEVDLPFDVNDFKSRLDNEWTDIFWKRKEVDYEEEYRTFFEILLFNYGLIEDDDKNWAQTLNYDNIPAEACAAAFYLLNFLYDNSNSDAASIVFNALDDKTASNYVSFHFVCVFLLKCGGSGGSENRAAMRDWVRVFGNLVNNTLIDNYNTAYDIIKVINNFSSNPENLTDVLSNISRLKRGFDKEQIKEEAIKAAVILAEREANGPVPGEFETAICDAEKFPFFEGQIRAGLYLSEDKNAKFGYDLKKFREYWSTIEKIFGGYEENSALQYGILLRRALLSIDDYTLTVDKSYKTLCSDHTDARGSISLKHLFSLCGKITEKLLNQAAGKSDIEAALEEIIENNIKKIGQTNWRYCLIKYPDLFEKMSAYYYRMRITNDGKVLLVRNSKSSGYNYEIFTDALKLELEQRTIEIHYDTEFYGNNKNVGRTTDGDYFVVYVGKHNKRYNIKFIDSGFVVTNILGIKLFRSGTPFPITETANYIEKIHKKVVHA